MNSVDDHIILSQFDIGEEDCQAARTSRVVAWDIETTGLDPRGDVICTCQIHIPSHGTVIVQIAEEIPDRLRDILADESIKKVFHHAPFDLRFMALKWKVIPANIACTKVAAKILNPYWESERFSLGPLLESYLNIEIDKAEQRSDWSSPYLTDSQIAYAANDVQFLLPLFTVLWRNLNEIDRASLAQHCYDFMPTRIRLDIEGYGDIFAY